MNPKVGRNRPNFIPAAAWNHANGGTGFGTPSSSNLNSALTSPDSAIGSPGGSPSSVSGGVSSPLSPYAAPFTSRRGGPPPQQSLSHNGNHFTSAQPQFFRHDQPIPMVQRGFAQENNADSLVGAMEAVKLPKPPCLCNRPRAVIYCKRCGFEMQGRKMTTCEAHPNRQALMDIQTCPKCRAPLNSLKELPPSQQQ